MNLWGQVITLRGQILAGRTDVDTYLLTVCKFKTPPVCTFKSSPCAPAPRSPTRQMNWFKMFRKKKKLLGRIILLFSSKVQNLAAFSIIYMIRIRFFGPGELIQKYFPAARCPWSTGKTNLGKGRLCWLTEQFSCQWEEKETWIMYCEFPSCSRICENIAHGHWSFHGPGSEKKWYGTHTYKPNGKWDRVAEDMMVNFSETRHPVFRASCALERGDLKKQRKGKIVFILLWRRQNR